MGGLQKSSCVSNPTPRRIDPVVALACSAVVAAFAITNQSLWIDEANAAMKAVQPSLGAWWDTLVTEKGSDLQMPLYMFYLWAWEKIAGHSEVALRFANIPWLLAAHYALFRTARRRELKPWPLLLITSVNPFLWFYMNEARPYVMQYAGSCLVICALSEFLNGSPRRDYDDGTSSALWFLTAGTILLGGSSM